MSARDKETWAKLLDTTANYTRVAVYQDPPLDNWIRHYWIGDAERDLPIPDGVEPLWFERGEEDELMQYWDSLMISGDASRADA